MSTTKRNAIVHAAVDDVTAADLERYRTALESRAGVRVTAAEAGRSLLRRGLESARAACGDL